SYSPAAVCTGEQPIGKFSCVRLLIRDNRPGQISPRVPTHERTFPIQCERFYSAICHQPAVYREFWERFFCLSSRRHSAGNDPVAIFHEDFGQRTDSVLAGKRPAGEEADSGGTLRRSARFAGGCATPNRNPRKDGRSPGGWSIQRGGNTS